MPKGKPLWSDGAALCCGDASMFAAIAVGGFAAAALIGAASYGTYKLFERRRRHHGWRHDRRPAPGPGPAPAPGPKPTPTPPRRDDRRADPNGNGNGNDDDPLVPEYMRAWSWSDPEIDLGLPPAPTTGYAQCDKTCSTWPSSADCQKCLVGSELAASRAAAVARAAR